MYALSEGRVKGKDKQWKVKERERYFMTVESVDEYNKCDTEGELYITAVNQYHLIETGERYKTKQQHKS